MSQYRSSKEKKTAFAATLGEIANPGIQTGQLFTSPILSTNGIEPKPPRDLFEKQQLPVRTTSHVQADSSRFPQRPAPRQSVPLAPGTPAFGELFRKRCVKCHGADGTGNKARDRLPEIPDFTNVSWQARRTDARL